MGRWWCQAGDRGQPRGPVPGRTGLSLVLPRGSNKHWEIARHLGLAGDRDAGEPGEKRYYPSIQPGWGYSLADEDWMSPLFSLAVGDRLKHWKRVTWQNNLKNYGGRMF